MLSYIGLWFEWLEEGQGSRKAKKKLGGGHVERIGTKVKAKGNNRKHGKSRPLGGNCRRGKTYKH